MRWSRCIRKSVFPSDLDEANDKALALGDTFQLGLDRQEDRIGV